MEEYGIQKVERKEDAVSDEFYILHDKTNEYEWLEFCKNEYFIKYDDQFGKNGGDRPYYIYGTYEECLEAENAIEKWLRKKIEERLDTVRVITIKKSDVKSIYDRIKALEESACSKNKTKKNIEQDIRMLRYKFTELTKI
jgi:predicted metal-dependent hydrolase